MIGVAVQASERAIASEFFELLKTQWEFCRNGERYDVVLSTSGDYVCEAPQLLLILRGEPTSFDTDHRVQVNSRRGGVVLSDAGKRIPVYGWLATFPAGKGPLLRDESTREPAAFAVCTGNSTIARIGYDLFEEVRFLLTIGQPAANAAVPALEEHIALLREWIARAGIPLVEIPPIPDGYNFIACLTHDIDHPMLRNHCCDHTMFGFLYRSTIGALLRVCGGRKPAGSLFKNWKAASLLPLVHLGIAKDYWSQFDRYLDLEAGHGSTFFVIPRPNYPGRTRDGNAPPMRACRYDVEELLPQLRRIAAADCEVGVHGLDAWLDADEGRREREGVSRAIGATEFGVRMHWLFFDAASPALLDRAGFTYDSTVGYCETVGFRAGTTQAYKFPGTDNLLELPLHVMDTALFYPSYLNLGESEAQGLVWRLIDDTARVGGALTINWHDRSIAPERLWGDFYLRLVGELERRKAWLPTASKAVAWFRKRRAATVDVAPSGEGMIKVRGRMNGADRLPGLRIRIHKPQMRHGDATLAPARQAEFVDVPFDDSRELNITL